MKYRLELPDTIEKDKVLMAHKIITGNVEGIEVNVHDEVYSNDSDTISLAVEAFFVGFIPKTWLVPVEANDEKI
jgi:hypothetical protein